VSCNKQGEDNIMTKREQVLAAGIRAWFEGMVGEADVKRVAGLLALDPEDVRTWAAAHGFDLDDDGFDLDGLEALWKAYRGKSSLVNTVA
jgi:hypothetical protein